nr:probable pectinesterase/pectinesterase inhibitor 51 [Tanacetum cinerariifolium]
MTIITLLFISLLTLLHPTTTATRRHIRISSDLIHSACQSTRYPQLCESSLSNHPTSTPMEIIQSALSISGENLRQAQSLSEQILKASTGVVDHVTAAHNCLEHLRNADYRLKSTVDILPRGGYKHARAWMSGGLAYQYDCWSALNLIRALDVFGDDVAKWAPVKTERDGFWESGGTQVGGELRVPVGLKADVTVCKNNGCDYGSVQEANVVMYGDGIGKTVITGSLNVGQPGLSTYNTATFGVVGDGFMASGLTIENTAGPDAHQAVAFRSDSDQSIIENCEFLGNQDTLYAHSLRQFYKSCIIQGNVDFIFGNSASIFQDCTILVRPRQLKPEKGENNAVTAHGRIDPGQSTGFVFQNCLINGTEEYMRLYYSKPKVHKNYLGRPWKEFSRTVFIDCNLEALITPQGWMPWTGDFALKTLYYGESGNTGKGSDLSARVTWSSQIPAEHVNVYSIGNFLQDFSNVSTPLSTLSSFPPSSLQVSSATVKSKAGKMFAFVRFIKVDNVDRLVGGNLCTLWIGRMHLHANVDRNYENCVMGEILQFSSISNLRILLFHDGFLNVRTVYLGGLWVMIELNSPETKNKLMN